MIEANKKPSQPSKSPSHKKSATVRLPPRDESKIKASLPRSKRAIHRTPPKRVTPGLVQDTKYLTQDQCRPRSAEVASVRLPCEPTTARALRFKPKGIFLFLELPGELRNRIYEYAIDTEDYAIEWVNNKQQSKSLTYRLPKLSRVFSPHLPVDAARRRRLLDYPRRASNPTCLPEYELRPGRTALLLTCKKVHEEAATVFYAKSTFGFHSLGTLRHFLNHLTPVSKESLKKIAMTYRAYGNPSRTDDQRWKIRHDRLWEDLCWRITDECTSLTHLSIDLTLNKTPVIFAPFDLADEAGLGAQWIKPLWAFQDAGIRRCWARLRCLGKDDSVLQVESWKVRKEILGDMWDGQAESKRDAYGFEKVRSTKKAIVFRIGNDGELAGV